MKYISTRGLEKDLSFEEVLFSGYAKDNGMYMPSEIPCVSKEELKSWSNFSYKDLMVAVLSKFIDEIEIPHKHLNDIVNNAFSNFKTPEIISIKEFNDGLNVIELFHGVTMAFKDLALSVVGTLIEYFLKKQQKKVIILVGTSGDTGSAAINSVKCLDNIDIIVLLPHGRCTQIQELQMTTVLDDNVHVYRVEGTSDDLDIPIKQCFEDVEFVKKHNLMSINSINWGRILAQITHHIYVYFRLCKEVGEPVEIIVPTGAAGNITGGSIAAMMGIPIRLVAAVNQNDIVGRTLKNGDFSINGSVIPSFSSAMDIQTPYNIERILFLYSGMDTSVVAELMSSFEDNKSVKIPNKILDSIHEIITDTVVATDDEVTEIMSRVYHDHNYILCPHSAVAVKYHNTRQCSIPRGYLATASPAKFPEAVIKSGISPVLEGVSHLASLPTKSKSLKKSDDWYTILKEKIEEISTYTN